MCLGDRSDTGELELLPKHPHRIRRGEEDAEFILYPPYYLPVDKHCNLWGACQHMRTVGNGVLQGLTCPGRSRVDWDSLLYVGL